MSSTVRQPQNGSYQELNQWQFARLLESALHRTRHDGIPVSVLLVDIDYLRKVNDINGDKIGDKVLSEIGPRIKSALRAEDKVARIGGEEFAIILPRAGNTWGRVLGERVRSAVEMEPFTSRLIRLTVSVGGASATGPEGTPQPHELLAQTDRALYRAKTAGRNRLRWHSAWDSSSEPDG